MKKYQHPAMHNSEDRQRGSKLRLARQTLRSISDLELREAIGGRDPRTSGRPDDCGSK